MSDDYAQELQNYWKWIDGLPEDVKKVVIKCWDETGRPTTHKEEPIIMLLDTCGTFEEFKKKYLTLLAGFDNKDDEWKRIDDATSYWAYYMAGMKRIVQEMTKDD